MSKLAHFVIAIAAVVMSLAIINALAGYTYSNISMWVLGIGR